MSSFLFFFLILLYFHFSNVRSFPSDTAQRQDSVSDTSISKKNENDNVPTTTATTTISRKEPIEPPIRNDGTLDYDGNSHFPF